MADDFAMDSRAAERYASQIMMLQNDSSVMDVESSAVSSSINDFHAGLYREQTQVEEVESSAAFDAHDLTSVRNESSNSERTLEKWEYLLRTCPRDPMAFYWREMIYWCKARTNGPVLESDIEPIGSKRQSGPIEEISEDLDILNVMVKRCRCNDDVIFLPANDQRDGGRL